MARFFFAFILFFSHFAYSQSLEIGIMAGGSNYQGELQDKNYDVSQMHLCFGGSLIYNFTPKWSVRAEIWKGNLSGLDAASEKQYSLMRNLSFNTRLYEMSLVGVYRFLSPELHRVSPYVFGGLAGFRVNPYTNDAAGAKNYLFLLSTEGQGMPQYPDVKAHKLNNISVPFGAGLMWAVGGRWSIGAELGLRYTFTDHIDDVSGNYVDPVLLQQERGDKAVELSYRGDELPGGSQVYPRLGSFRGNPDTNDWYYNAVIRFQYSLFGKTSVNGWNSKQLSCPSL